MHWIADLDELAARGEGHYHVVVEHKVFKLWPLKWSVLSIEFFLAPKEDYYVEWRCLYTPEKTSFTYEAAISQK